MAAKEISFHDEARRRMFRGVGNHCGGGGAAQVVNPV